MTIFQSADILLPREDALGRWAVIACDQFSSEPGYWEETEKLVGNAPSALRLILPEARLGQDNTEAADSIHRRMEKYLQSGLFREYKNAFVYVERCLSDGSVRQGVVGMLDLECYDYAPDSKTPVRATEATVPERIPPRMRIREGAALELPHTLLLMDDPDDLVIGLVGRQKAALPKLYDFELMQGGGHIAGWLMEGVIARKLRERLDAYAKGRALVFAVGDGNHSLATAKACWEAYKAAHPGVTEHPLRYALVELENLHSPAQKWEAIHRVVTSCDAERLIEGAKAALDTDAGEAVTLVSGERECVIHVPGLALAAVQDFLDGYLKEHAGELDYIHGEESLRALAKGENAVGFLLPKMKKEELFPGVETLGALPRKSFSMGKAREKRYYLEARSLR